MRERFSGACSGVFRSSVEGHLASWHCSLQMTQNTGQGDADMRTGPVSPRHPATTACLWGDLRCPARSAERCSQQALLQCGCETGPILDFQASHGRAFWPATRGSPAGEICELITYCQCQNRSARQCLLACCLMWERCSGACFWGFRLSMDRALGTAPCK